MVLTSSVIVSRVVIIDYVSDDASQFEGNGTTQRSDEA